jgi:MoaA/NifB/PqqE/SkfB family radical SAM enzyme
MGFINYEDIRVFGVEHTNKCNLRCPACPRTAANKQVNPVLHMTQWTLDDYKRIFTPEFCKQLKGIVLCGCNGDAIVASNIMECVKYLRSNDLIVNIHTNGSLRESSWWKELAHIMGKESKLVFAIDGVTQEINKINRVFSNLDIILRNVKAYIDAGGTARWDFLDFDYNHHQLEAARKMAKDMGFLIFNSRTSTAHISNKEFLQNFDENVYEGDDKQFKEVLKRYGTWKKYIDETPIICKSQLRKEMYIDHQLRLWPCPWLGGAPYINSDVHIQKNQLIELSKKYGEDFNSLRNKSIEEVLQHPWFQKDLSESWGKTFSTGKMMHCGKMCGEFYRASTTEEKNKTMEYLKETI